MSVNRRDIVAISHKYIHVGLKTQDLTFIVMDYAGRLVAWCGPYGAVHYLKPDFWKRNNILTKQSIHSKVPQEYIIHISLVEEFNRYVDTTRGQSHVTTYDEEFN